MGGTMRYFLDTEFNGYRGELISLALVAEDGRELYVMSIDRREPTVDWVQENVIPKLSAGDADPVCWPASEIGFRIEEFLAADPTPHIIADWPDDIKYFCQVIIIAPGQMVNIPRLTFEVSRVDAYPTSLPNAVQHNALC
jgi:hypothetical protein